MSIVLFFVTIPLILAHMLYLQRNDRDMHLPEKV
jgi:hypothetical protein